MVECIERGIRNVQLVNIFNKRWIHHHNDVNFHRQKLGPTHSRPVNYCWWYSYVYKEAKEGLVYGSD